ncbi:MAG: amidohydrolase family protein [Mucilaginibacter sp.]
MRNFKRAIILLIAPALWSCTQNKKAAATVDSASADTAYYTLADYKKVRKYDVHVHLLKEDTTFIKQSLAENFYLLDVNVDVQEIIPIEEQQKIALKNLKQFPNIFQYATAFTVRNWNDPKWLEKSLAYIKDSFAKGAITIKIWKNIGMVLKDKDGKYVKIDDPRFDPILDYLAKNRIPVMGHLGDPQEAWWPIDSMTVKGDIDYFTAHPEYYSYLHPEFPKWEEVIGARDHMLEKHPDLKFVGVHLGGLEWSIDELAKRLDKFPNMAVDVAERLPHIQRQSITRYDDVRKFFLKYQDRILYGTDIIVDGTKTPEEMKKHAYDIRIRHWKYFTSDDKMTAPELLKGEFKGLKLPKEVVDKIYRRNAELWLNMHPKG